MVHQPLAIHGNGYSLTYDPSLRRKTPLALALVAEIARSGPIPVAEYMQRCLWDPSGGYYATRNPLGRSGDFITAPEISQVFGELIGLWSAVVWRDVMGAPGNVTLLELGPGRGTLMRDALRATKSLAGFRQALRCHLVEASQPLIDVQRATLTQSSERLSWSSGLARCSGPAIIVANEFFDALPIDQWTMTSEGWRARAVGLDETGTLSFTTLTGGESVTSTDEFPDAPAGAIVERSHTDELLENIATLATTGPVAAIIVDYGHTASGVGDTLQAVRAHAHEHPLSSPGEADLSAQVDFARLAATARQAGLEVDEPVSQGEFLGRLGIVERARTLMSANPAIAGEIEVAIARLISPEAMGSRFKVLGLRSAGLPALP